MQLNLSLKGSAGLEIAFKTFRLLLFVSFWSFFFACVFVTIELYYIGERGFYYQHGFLWLTSSPALDYVSLYDEFEWAVWFEYSLFFVMQMVRGCGLGVPAPRCPLSMLWYNISNVTMTALFLYFTDKVISVINKFMARSRLVENLGSLKGMRRIMSLSYGDYRHYRKFLEASVNADIRWAYLEAQLHDMVKGNLRKDLDYGMKQHFTLRFKFLRPLFSDSLSEELFRRELASRLTTKVVYPGEVLFRRRQVSKARLYLSEASQFIVSNELLEYAERLPEWSFVGLREFFIDRRSLFDVVASQVATV